jgi:hypothetical protein
MYRAKDQLKFIKNKSSSIWHANTGYGFNETPTLQIEEDKRKPQAETNQRRAQVERESQIGMAVTR